MATAEACHVAYDPGSYQCNMGSVGSLIEKQDFSGNMNFDLRTAKGCIQPKSFPKKGATQKELLSYLNFTKKDWKTVKKPAVAMPSQRERITSDSENGYTGMHCREHRGTDFTKTSLPERGHYDKLRVDPSSFQPLGVNSFFSMQNLSSSGGQKLSQSYNSLNAPVHTGPLKATHLHPISLDEREEEADSVSDTGPQSFGPSSGPTWVPLSTSTGHLNHIGGSLDRATRGSAEPASCKSMAMLNRLHSTGDPPPYEYSCSMEDVVRKLEEQLQQKGGEGRPQQRSPSTSEDPFAQVCEDKRRLWMEELEELKQMYVMRLQQVSQHSLRSQRVLQLQLYKVQQEKKRLQEDLHLLQAECEDLKQKQSPPGGLNPKAQSSKSEDSQREGAMSLLRQQLRDSQAELAQKVDEVFNLKNELRKAKALAREMDVGVCPGESFRTLQPSACPKKEGGTSPGEPFRSLQYPKSHVKEATGPSTSFRALQHPGGHIEDATEFSSCETDDSKCQGLQGECTAPAEARIERLQAALRLERRQSEELLGAFESERRTWKQEKERVLKYQREIQTGYMEMYHRSQALEQELQDLRRRLPDHKVPTSLWVGKVDSSDT